MLGKYSPTVDSAYDHDQDWFEKYAGYNQYDPEGYDYYGYNRKDIDRAGNHEDSYARVCQCCGQAIDSLYYDTKLQWGFDGVKPVKMT